MTLKLLGISGMLMAAFALSAAPALAHSKPAFFGKQPTVAIDASGNVLVRGAEVSSIGNGSLTATTEWNNTELTWTVDTDSDTDFIDRDNDEADLDDFDVGDIVSFAGLLSGSLDVDATVVRAWPDEDDVSNRDDDRKDEKKDEGRKHFKWPFVSFWNSFKANAHF